MRCGHAGVSYSSDEEGDDSTADQVGASHPALLTLTVEGTMRIWVEVTMESGTGQSFGPALPVVCPLALSPPITLLMWGGTSVQLVLACGPMLGPDTRSLSSSLPAVQVQYDGPSICSLRRCTCSAWQPCLAQQQSWSRGD